MNKLVAAMTAAVALSTAASASTVGADYGFFMVDGVADGATEILWTDGYVKLFQTDSTLTVEIAGRENLPFVEILNEQNELVQAQTLTAWVIDWSMPYETTNKFDLYLNPPFNSHCQILVTPIVDDWDTENQNLFWNEATNADGGFCAQNGESGATLTTNLATMPLPAGAMLILTGLAGFGAMRRFS